MHPLKKLDVIVGSEVIVQDVKKTLYYDDEDFFFDRFRKHPDKTLFFKSDDQYVGFVQLKSKKIFQIEPGNHYVNNTPGLIEKMVAATVEKTKEMGYDILVVPEVICGISGDFIKNVNINCAYNTQKFSDKITRYIFLFTGAPETNISFIGESLVDVHTLIESIEKYHIQDQDQIYQLIKISMRNNFIPTLKNFQQFKFTDQKKIFEIAKKYANVGIKDFSKYFDCLGITSEKQRYQIAKIAFKTFYILWDDKELDDLISKYNIQNPIRLKKLLLFLAKKQTTIPIKHLLLQDKEFQIHYAIEFGKKNGSRLGENFQKLQFKQLKDRLEVIWGLLNSNQTYINGLCVNIKIFEIEDENERVKIVNHLIDNKAHFSIIKYFDQFEISSEKKRFDFAMKLAEIYPETILENLEKFRIEKKTYRMPLAIKLAKVNRFSQYLKKFGEFTADERYRLAKIAVENDPTFAEYFFNYSISPPLWTDELASIFGNHFPNDCIMNFTNFNFSNEDVKVKLLKKLARREPKRFILDSYRIEIKNKEQLLEIFEIAFKKSKDLKYRFRLFQNVKFPDIKHRIALSKKLIHYSPVSFVINIEKFGLTLTILREFLPELIRGAPEQTINILKDFELNENQYEKVHHELLQRIQFNSLRLKYQYQYHLPVKEIKKTIEEIILKDFEEIIKKIENEKNEEFKKNLEKWIKPVFDFLMYTPYSNENLISDLRILYDYRDPKMRFKITRQRLGWFFKENKPYQNKWREFSKEIKSFPITHMLLVPFYVKDSTLQERVIPFLKRFKSVFNDNVKNRLFHHFLLLLLKYENPQLLNSILSMQKKESVKLKFFIQSLISLNNLGNGKFIKKIKNINQAPEYLEQAFIKKFNLDTHEDFADLYYQTFGNYRDPNAIISYGSCIQKLPEEEKELAIPLFKLYFTSVMKGTFFDVRYDLSNSVHMKAVFENRPELLTKWKNGEKIDSSHLLEWKENNQSTVNFYKFLKDKIYENNHLGYPFLKEAFERDAQILEEKNSDLILQKKIIQFFDKRMDKERAQEAVSELLAIVPRNTEFYSDLIAYEKRLTTRKLDVEKLVVLDTDNSEDLLLIGTETPSCQRVNGDPDFNKCLLDYLLDGKIRAIVVKNRYGRIVARCLLKILLDEVTGKPVLFQERIYSNNSSVNQLIKTMCLMRSKQLNLPLLVKKKSKKYQKYPNNIESKGSISPYEYVDALGGVTNGKYQIHSDKLLLVS